MIDTIIFDFDGTIADTSNLIIQSWQHTFRTMTGQEYDEKELYKYFGEPLAETMLRFFPEEDLERCLETYREYQLGLGDEAWVLFPGMKELIENLHDQGITVGIVTSRTDISTRRALRYFGMEDLFKAIVSCEDTTVHKPNGEPCEIGLQKLGAKAENTLFVGDTIYDMGCAHNAGVRAVLVDWTLSMDGVDATGIFAPDFTLEHPDDLLKVMKQC